MEESTFNELKKYNSLAVKEGNIPGREIHAVLLFREIAPLYPDKGFVWFNYGMNLYEVDRFQEATVAFKKCLNFKYMKQPKQLSSVYLGISGFMDEIGRYPEAAHWIELAIKEKTPVPGFCWILLGKYQIYLGNLEKAIECFDRALISETPPVNKDEALLNKGIVYCRLKKYAEGHKLIKKSLDIDSTVKLTQLRLQDIDKMRETQETIESMQSSPSKDKLDQIFKLANTYYNNDLDFSAYELYSEYLKHRPDHYEGWFEYAKCLCAIERWEEGLTALERCKQLDDGSHTSEIQARIGEIYFESGFPKEAENEFAKSIDAANQVSDWVWFKRGKNFIKLGNYTQARKCFEESLECQDRWIKTNEIFLHIGLMFRCEERFEEAIWAFSKAVNLNPKNQKAKECLDGLSGIDETLKTCKKIASLKEILQETDHVTRST